MDEQTGWLRMSTGLLFTNCIYIDDVLPICRWLSTHCSRTVIKFQIPGINVRDANKGNEKAEEKVVEKASIPLFAQHDVSLELELT